MFSYGRFLSIVDRQVDLWLARTPTPGSDFYVEDRELGWVIRPNAVNDSGSSRADSMGFRVAEARTVDHGGDRVPVLSMWGCSLVQGCNVPDQETWAWQLNDRLRGSFRVLNGGVSAYGLDQAFLRLQRYSAQARPPAVAMLGYATSDLLRNVNVQRTLLQHSGEQLTMKPRYVLRGEGSLELVRPPYVPIADAKVRYRERSIRDFLRRYDRMYPFAISEFEQRVAVALRVEKRIGPRVRATKEALQVTVAIYDAFFRYCDAQGTVGVALLLPVYRGSFCSGADFDVLVEQFRRSGRPFIDPRPTFARAGDPTRYFTRTNHYTLEGGGLMTDAILAGLSEFGLAAGQAPSVKAVGA